MDLHIWMHRYFDENSKIEWSCPNCNLNTLELVKEKLFSEEKAESIKFRNENEDWDIECIELIFSGKLICKNCGESIFFTGIGNPSHCDYYSEDLKSHIQYVDTFKPTYFEPFIKIFNIPKKCSKELRTEIENSFKLFWSDLPSCANKIRISLEIFLNEQKVKRYENKNGKRKEISLHRRIELYNNSEIKDSLLAIKWIGNTGSHIGEIETIDILDAYQLLEFSINKIYNDESRKITKITKEINKRKGIRKKHIAF